MANSNELETLERFLLNNPELDTLEGLLSEFNVFETLNMINAEVRHSNVLAWLLNPSANHGLGDYFLRQFLKHFVTANKTALSGDISLFDVEMLDLSEIEIRREWNNIDLLVVIEDEEKKLLITIENKIKSSEHSNQLQRYRQIVEKEFPQHLKLYIYLTPENVLPSDDNWVPFDYATIADLIDTLLKYRSGTVSEGVIDFIVQYNTILRRYIVGNSQVEEICRQIYRKHKSALDLIFQYKPDVQLDLNEYLQQKIQSTESLIPDISTKTYIHFTSRSIDNVTDKISEGWTKTNRLLLFEFRNLEQRLTLNLIIGPGPKDYREKLFSLFSRNTSLFTLAKAGKYFGKKYHTVYQKVFLAKKDYQDATAEDLSLITGKKWHDFVSNDLVKIEAHFTKHWNAENE